MPAKIQRYRSPYFTGDTSTQGFASSTFRTELRTAAGGAFPSGRTHENGRDQQAMAYVPMDQSGLDHDFYIYKYQAAPNGSGAMDRPLADDAIPANNNGSGNWRNWTAACSDYYFRNRNLSHSGLWRDGSGSNNTTTQAMRSYRTDTVGLTITGVRILGQCVDRLPQHELHGRLRRYYQSVSGDKCRMGEGVGLGGSETRMVLLAPIQFLPYTGRPSITVEGGAFDSYNASQSCNTDTKAYGAQTAATSAHRPDRVPFSRTAYRGTGQCRWWAITPSLPPTAPMGRWAWITAWMA